MSFESYHSDSKRIRLELTEVSEPEPLILGSNGIIDDFLNSPSDTGENTSIISAFDHDSSSILSGSFYESGGEILLESSIKSILKSTEVICKNSKEIKNRIQFQEIEIFYFNRQQSFCSVPSVGGSALGMEMQHFLTEKVNIDKYNYFSGTRSYDSGFYDKNPKEEYSILQPIVAKHRRMLLKNSGTSRIETVDKEVCDLIRSSRERCGCQCVEGQCLPEICSCVQNGIQCQVDRGNFPCGCGPNTCANPLGRVEFNPIRVRTHFIHTLMRLQMQDQYQSEKPKEILKGLENQSSENAETVDRLSKEFDVNASNSTDQGSCRDCQNDKYLQVLMNEWTHQLQRLHTSKHYPPTVSIPYNSRTYIPETFYSSTYCDKDVSMIPILPYPQWAFSNLPTLNLGLPQVNYLYNPPENHYRSSNVSYSNHYVGDGFHTKSNNSIISCSDEYFQSINYNKHQIQNISSIKPNTLMEPLRPDDHITSSVCALSQETKPHCFQLEKVTSYCKYDTPLSSIQSDLKDGIPSPYTYLTTLPYYLHKPNHEINLVDPSEDLLAMCESPTILLDDNHHHNKVTHASNGQLYTVLQPVSQSGIVSSFYQNSQASDLCNICRYKSPDNTSTNRQPRDHLCISDFTLTTSNDNNLQLPLEYAEHPEVCA